jgi:hypothetical protein
VSLISPGSVRPGRLSSQAAAVSLVRAGRTSYEAAPAHRASPFSSLHAPVEHRARRGRAENEIPELADIWLPKTENMGKLIP